MGRAFERFWRDDDDLRSSMLACVRRVMQVMAKVPAVVGYDPFNEPMGSLGALLGGALEQIAASLLRGVHPRARRA